MCALASEKKCSIAQGKSNHRKFNLCGCTVVIKHIYPSFFDTVVDNTCWSKFGLLHVECSAPFALKDVSHALGYS